MMRDSILSAIFSERNKMIKINSKSDELKPEIIQMIEKKYSANYIYESQLKSKDGWTDISAAIFYQPEPKPGHSHWFAIHRNYLGQMFVSDASTTVAVPVTAVQVAEDEYLYSHHRHHFLGRDGIAIDGGRDYTRLVGNISEAKLVLLKATPDGLVITEDVI